MYCHAGGAGEQQNKTETQDTTSLHTDKRLVMASKESSHGQVIVDAANQGHWAQDSCLIGHSFWDLLQELELLVWKLDESQCYCFILSKNTVDK